MSPQSITRRSAMAFAALALAAAQPAVAQTKWNLPGAYPASNYHSETMVWFAEEVKKATATPPSACVS